jgi:hypothetical protein
MDESTPPEVAKSGSSSPAEEAMSSRQDAKARNSLYRVRLLLTIYVSGGLMGHNRAIVQMYRPGEEVPKSGIYRVRHQGHHHDHEVTCISGEQFPECKQCKGGVRFSLIIAARAIERHIHFSGVASERPEDGDFKQSA